jgi:hypothetical protein
LATLGKAAATPSGRNREQMNQRQRRNTLKYLIIPGGIALIFVAVLARLSGLEPSF